ncbi:MAG TPA: CaiB/BaiF CoA-transferase family protein [Chloroflexota bacterium]|nr:CaiB/BaiF CoA-transferase family protein [Chloroflexota bacterium]
MGALDGLRVLDLGTFIAAPFAAGLLAEQGATVIKVEQPGGGDPIRDLGDKVRGRALFWALEGRGRRSVTCNLRHPKGQALALGLVRHSDLVIENFRPGTLERWNLGYDRLRAVNPGVVLLRISAYGQTGRLAARPGFGRVAQAFGGLTYLAGEPDRPPAIPGSPTIADYRAGLFGAFSARAALRVRERSGEGQVIDVSLFESVFRLTDYMAPAYDALGVVRERNGASGPHAAPHNHYPTADDKWVAIACTSDRIFRRLVAAMTESGEGEDWSADPGLGTMSGRVARREEVDARVRAWTRRFAMRDLCARLDAADVPNSPIYSVADAFADPQYADRGTLTTVDDPVIGPLRLPAPVPRLSRTPAVPPSPAPDPGEHNAAVYGDLLGLGAAELENLRAEGVV